MDKVSTPTERVQAGMRLLDERGPEGWADRLDLEKLDMDSCFLCVLGQLSGTFAEGWHVFDMTPDEIRNGGFAAYLPKAARPLTRAWVKAIKRRRDVSGK